MIPDLQQPVTLRRKCYVSVCLGCDGLFTTARADTLTCSPACRVRVHRHPEALASLRTTAKRLDITAASILRAAAIDRVRPDLVAAIRAGSLTLDDAQPEVWRAFWDRLCAATREGADA